MDTLHVRCRVLDAPEQRCRLLTSDMSAFDISSMRCIPAVAASAPTIAELVNSRFYKAIGGLKGRPCQLTRRASFRRKPELRG